MEAGSSPEEYIRQVLDGYRNTPGTTGTVRRPDRMLAAQLYQRGISVTVIENAMALAAARRLMRPVIAPPLGTIRSLAYFLPVIEEVLELRVSPDYFRYVRPAPRTHPSATVGIGTASPLLVRAFGADDGTATRTPSAWMISPGTQLSPARLRRASRYANLSAVPRLGHFCRALLGRFCQVPKSQCHATHAAVDTDGTYDREASPTATRRLYPLRVARQLARQGGGGCWGTDA